MNLTDIAEQSATDAIRTVDTVIQSEVTVEQALAAAQTQATAAVALAVLSLHARLPLTHEELEAISLDAERSAREATRRHA